MQTIELVKDKIKYRADRLEKSRVKFEEEQYNYANYIVGLHSLKFDLSSLHSDEEIATLNANKLAYEAHQNHNESVSEKRWDASNEVRRVKAERRQHSNGPKRGKRR